MNKQPGKVLIIQHSDKTPAGSTLEWLNQNHIPYEIIFARDVKDWAMMNKYSLIILCGGGMNVDQEHLYPWLRSEKIFIHQQVAAGTKFLGLCLGGQLLAEALGGTVEKHKHWEVGWHQVEIDSSTSPFFAFSKPSLKVFQFHGYRFYTPPNCKRIVSNNICSDQGFVYQNQIVGFQFHPEATQKWIIECCEPGGEEKFPAGPFVQHPQDIKEHLASQKELQSWYFAFLDAMWGSD